MARPPRKPVESLIAAVPALGRVFTFRLHTRPLRLGDAGTVQYYWMDSSRFRIARGGRASDPANFRGCLDHWWTAMRSMGLGDDPVQLKHLLLATAHALISAGKGMQRVYRDAHLAGDATDPTGRSLDPDSRGRIGAVVAARDADRVRIELDATLGGPALPAPEAATIRECLAGILDRGVEWVRARGESGLEEFLGKFDAFSEKLRKKGGQDWRRRLLDHAAYECKTSFYRCYANSWIDLIPWLREHRGLDELSERFLRFWHMQNQPAEDPDGVEVPDAFRGQVLSLHPLSGFFMKDPALLAVAGNFFGPDAAGRGAAGAGGAYWDLVGAILTAAALYRQALDEQAAGRGVRTRTGLGPDGASVAGDGRPDAALLEDYAAALGHRCSRCGGPLAVASLPVAGGADVRDVAFVCRDGGHENRLTIARRDLADWLMPSD